MKLLDKIPLWVFVVVRNLIALFCMAYLTHAYDISHDNCGHFHMLINGLYEDLPKIEPEE